MAAATQSACSKGVFATEEAAEQALDRALERARQEQGLAQTPTLGELVEIYLAQHDTEPETVEKLRWLLSKATAAFGNTPISELQPTEIAAWRMTIRYGHRFEATQALPQTLARAVSWGMINDKPAKQGVENPQRPRIEQRPFESWDELQWLADRLGRHISLIVLFAASTGLRPSEWLALEHRDIDLAAGVVYVRRAYRNGRIKYPKTTASYRAVPLQAIALDALDALDALPRRTGSALLFPAPAAATSTCTTSATATGNPPNATSQSTRSGAYTISGTPSPRSRSAPASPPSTSPATWAPA